MAATVQRHLSFKTLPSGEVEATLAITMPDGKVQRFVSRVHPNEVAGDEVGSIFGSIFHALKKAGHSIGHIAKKIATSKVLAIAAAGLTAAIPFAGPAIAGPLIAATAGLAVASKLHKAGLAAKAGLHDVARSLTHSAVADAHKLSGGKPAAAQQILDAANKHRQNADKIAASGEPAPLPPIQNRGDILDHARAGRVLSNSGEPVSEAELRQAAASGRVFWVAA